MKVKYLCEPLVFSGTRTWTGYLLIYSTAFGDMREREVVSYVLSAKPDPSFTITVLDTRLYLSGIPSPSLRERDILSLLMVDKIHGIIRYHKSNCTWADSEHNNSVMFGFTRLVRRKIRESFL